ncbi:hypothetical protein TrRE_jg1004 [Triparma retinervis]|uniref:tRNA (guanine(9)-N(1))-methyltransferase n=1 Tax=Triparma retinervis TaxID=2557542 RepID=A0A9W7E0P4_9STRA|nr:hypothetical protein TrRE_jg1004 [Triparma retinervis]
MSSASPTPSSTPTSTPKSYVPPPPPKPYTHDGVTYPSKKAWKKAVKTVKWEAKKVKMKEEKKEEKKRKREERGGSGDGGGGEEGRSEEDKIEAKRRRDDKKAATLKSRTEAADKSFNVVIDCGWNGALTPKEKKSLGKQIAYCYSFNRKQQEPVWLRLSGADEETKKYPAGLEGFPGRAKDLGVECRKLALGDGVLGTKVLTVNHVFEILCRGRDGEWREAVEKSIPKRKGGQGEEGK